MAYLNKCFLIGIMFFLVFRDKTQSSGWRIEEVMP